jgi:hypothetical protein
VYADCGGCKNETAAHLWPVSPAAPAVRLYYGLQYYRVQKNEAARIARKVFEFVPADLQELTLDRIDEDPCKVERTEDGAWRILEPNATIVPFQMMWDRIAEHLSQTLNEHTVMSAPKDLALYGLDTPILTVSGNTKDGYAFTLNFGEIEPTQRSRYAQLNGGDLFLITTDTFFELNRSLIDLRHKFLVDDREAALLEMEFAWIWTGSEEKKEGQPEIGTESIVVAVKRDTVEAPWRMTAPEEAPANHAAVEALAAELQFAAGREFIDHPENLCGLRLGPRTGAHHREGRRIRPPADFVDWHARRLAGQERALCQTRKGRCRCGN